MVIRKVIYADEGKVLTNGEVYGTQIFLADGANENDFHEITAEEYEQILAENSDEFDNGNID